MKVGLFRALQLGDMLCAVPAVRALRQSYPELEITLIGLPWGADLLRRFPDYFSDFMEFPGYNGLPEQPYDPLRFRRFIERLKSEKFDLLIQMQGNGSVVNRMLAGAGIPLAGYCIPGRENPAGTFLPYPDHLPEIMRHLELARFLGAGEGRADLEFPVLPDEAKNYEELKMMYDLAPGSYMVVHPGARDHRRCWPAEHFASVADRMGERGYGVVLTGTRSEHELVSLVERKMERRAVNLCGRTSPGALLELLRHSRLLFSNDTGVSHLAAAAGARSLVLFLTSDPDRWGPPDRERHQRILPEEAKNPEYVLSILERAFDAQVR